MATRSGVSRGPAGRLHRPDDARAESREADGSRRTAALIGRETPGSPRTEEPRRARGDGCLARERRKPNRATRTAAGALLLFWGLRLLVRHGWDSRAERVAVPGGDHRTVRSPQPPADDRRPRIRGVAPSPTDESRTAGNADLLLRLLARLWNSCPATMSDAATVWQRSASRTTPGVSAGARESLLAASHGGWPMNLMSIRRGSQRRLGRPSAVIAGATVTDSTVSVINRRHAARRFAGSDSLSMSSGPMTLVSPRSPSRAGRCARHRGPLSASQGSPGWRAGLTIQARRAAGSFHRDPRWRV